MLADALAQRRKALLSQEAALWVARCHRQVNEDSQQVSLVAYKKSVLSWKNCRGSGIGGIDHCSHWSALVCYVPVGDGVGSVL